jgi:hypothetical protein
MSQPSITFSYTITSLKMLAGAAYRLHGLYRLHDKKTLGKNHRREQIQQISSVGIHMYTTHCNIKAAQMRLRTGLCNCDHNKSCEACIEKHM